MRIAIVHNYYRSANPSGESTVVANEMALLRSGGHVVQEFSCSSDQISDKGILEKISLFYKVTWNLELVNSILGSIKKFNPDVIHVHNTFPLISPAFFRVAKNVAPVVLTLHNFRIFCAAGIPLRDGTVCTKCLDERSVIPALRFGCYRNSLFTTIPIALSISVHRSLGTWSNFVDKYICLTEFQKNILSDAGLPAYKCVVKPNFVRRSSSPQVSDAAIGGFLYVGRLSSEKGVVFLIRAWRILQAKFNSGEINRIPSLNIVGDGELRDEMESLANGLPIKFWGKQSSSFIDEAMVDSTALIVPSVWFEGFPMVVVEAFSHGLPVLASDIGSLREIISSSQAGLLFATGDSMSIASTVAELISSTDSRKIMSERAVECYNRHYSPDRNLVQLEEIYQSLLTRGI